MRIHPVGAMMFSDNAWEAIAATLRLSQRESQIVRGVFNDKTEFAIAADLGISPHTVHTHFERLHRKLAIHDRTQMVLRVIQTYLTLTASPDHKPASVLECYPRVSRSGRRL